MVPAPWTNFHISQWNIAYVLFLYLNLTVESLRLIRLLNFNFHVFGSTLVHNVVKDYIFVITAPISLPQSHLSKNFLVVFLSQFRVDEFFTGVLFVHPLCFLETLKARNSWLVLPWDEKGPAILARTVWYSGNCLNTFRKFLSFFSLN